MIKYIIMIYLYVEKSNIIIYYYIIYTYDITEDIS